MDKKDFVGADSISAREETERGHMECPPTDSTKPDCETVGGGTFDAPEGEVAQPWYIDLKKEEFVAFRMLMARLMGPLRQRIPTLVVSVLCFLTLVGYALFEWWSGVVTSPDPVLLVGAALVLIPSLIIWLYVPYHLRRAAEKQYDRSVGAGMDYCGELIVNPDSIEKVGFAVTACLRIDERMRFIEKEDMMVVLSVNAPAIVLPARCLTDEMARAVRQAMEKLPTRNRVFYERVQPQGEVVTPPALKQKPEELWVNTFTYTTEEYAVVMKGIIQQHFWRMAPVMTAGSMMAALAFGYDGESLLPCIWYFLAFMAALILLNLVLPLRRVAGQIEKLSTHDLTMQVRMDTMSLRIKLPKGGENWVLWCDVDHVYEHEKFVEIVHNKKASLYIPKRVIPDLDALDAIIKRCRGEQ